MIFDGAGANAELMGDNLVGIAVNEMIQDIALARRKGSDLFMSHIFGLYLRLIQPPRFNRSLDGSNEQLPVNWFLNKISCT
jgi:hypothetical protein